MLANYPIFYVARLILETRTPLSISTGRNNGTFDTVLVRDANGLPVIPGSSFAGVLRHLYQYSYDEKSMQSLFGQANINHERSSQVHVSWGYLHDSHNRPIEGLVLDPLILKDDPVLSDALQQTPIIRNHIRLTHRGTSAEQAQFERTSLRAGHRFSIELSLWSDNPEDERWENLLALLNRADFRLGGATRRGLGALRVISLHAGQFNLKDAKGFAAYQCLSNKLAEPPSGNLLIERTLAKIDSFPQVQIRLTPRDGYRFGQGTEPFFVDDKADLLPVREQKVRWYNNQGVMSDDRYIVIPASGVKGALSHRVAFHYNAIKGYFADTLTTKPNKNNGYSENKAVTTLFGFAKEKSSGQIGHLLLDDLYLKPKVDEAFLLVHNGVDRFTGGVREHMLFNEEVVGQKTTLELSLTVITHPKNPALKEQAIRDALAMTLTDLTEGRLALGAGGGRGGYGYFTGQLNWSDEGAWIQGK